MIKGVHFGGLNHIPLNFGSQTPKNWNFWPWSNTTTHRRPHDKKM